MKKINVSLDAKLEPDGSLVCLLDFEGRKAKVIFGGPPNLDVVFETHDDPRYVHDGPGHHHDHDGLGGELRKLIHHEDPL